MNMKISKKTGEPVRQIGPRGKGNINKNGYRRIARVLEHVAIAQHAIGKPLPPGAEVHHVDKNKLNNAPSNLVICPSNAYHTLLHARMKAMDACGNPSWRKCQVCGVYDALENLYIPPGRGSIRHAACFHAYRVALAERKQNAGN